MPEMIDLEIATPDRQLVHEKVDMVEAPGKTGCLGILPGHAALVSELGEGVLTYAAGGRRQRLAVAGGFLEVLPDHVRVLAEVAQRAEDINLEQARADLKSAQEAVAAASSSEEASQSNAAQRRAEARIASVEAK
jgi:F-type H+-transporting ATPase subunit epsilon